MTTKSNLPDDPAILKTRIAELVEALVSVTEDLRIEKVRSERLCATINRMLSPSTRDDALHG